MSNYGILLSTPRERSESMLNKPQQKRVPTQEQWDWFESQLTPEIWKRLFNEAYRVVQNKPDAEDVLQDAIQIGVCKLDDLRNKEKFFSWMFNIVRREAYRHSKREKKLQKILLPLRLLKDCCTVTMTPENLMITKEERARLRREIGRIPSPDREILLMKLTTDLSLKEIADELDLNYHTTRSKYTRTRQLIRKRIKMSEGGDGSHEAK